MKKNKIGLLIVTLLLAHFAFAENMQSKKIRNAKLSDLTTVTQEFMKQYFPNAAIDYISVDGNRKAEIELKDGTEIEFGMDGYFKEIENEKGLQMPHLQMLPGQMLTSLKDDFAKYQIEKVEHKNLYYKVELKGANGKEIEIRYDLNGQYLY